MKRTPKKAAKAAAKPVWQTTAKPSDSDQPAAKPSADKRSTAEQREAAERAAKRREESAAGAFASEQANRQPPTSVQTLP